MKEWWWECHGSVLGINSGPPRDTPDVWADLCGNSHSRGRMSAGQTGQMTGQMGHVHGTDGTHTPWGVPPNVFMFIGLFLSPVLRPCRPSTAVSRPSGPKTAKKSPKSLPGPSGPESQKSPEKVEKSPK